MVPRRAVEGRLLVVRGRVEALEPRVAVVVSVRVVAVEDEVARDLDLVRRVVREVPGLGCVAEADLQHRCRNEQHPAHHDREDDREPPWPGADAPGRCCDEGDEQAGQNGGRAEDAEVPLAVGDPDERAEETTRMHGGRHEGPRVGAELRDRDRDEHAQRRQEQPWAATIHSSSMASFRDSTYEASMANTTARASGVNRYLAGPSRKTTETKTMQTVAKVINVAAAIAIPARIAQVAETTGQRPTMKQMGLVMKVATGIAEGKAEYTQSTGLKERASRTSLAVPARRMTDVQHGGVLCGWSDGFPAAGSVRPAGRERRPHCRRSRQRGPRCA